jgi:hypothetical protein
MNSNELRIGNWVLYEGKPTKVDEIFIGAFKHLKAEPIELTAEVLEKAGFEWYKPLGHWRIVKNELWFSVTKMLFDEPKEECLCFSYANLAWDEAQSMPPKIVRYLHQLQNLFYCLTGNELNITLC